MNDLISRQAVIDAIRSMDRNDHIDECTEGVIEYFEKLPSAEKTAEWILFDEDKNVYECSSCKEPFILISDTPKENNYNYCPNCGAKMKGEA